MAAARAMRVLGLDTATTGCSAALWEDGIVVARRFEEMETGQTERLNPMIAEVMAESGTAFPALAAVGVTLGPGAFTGLRIGLATARAISLGCRVPAIGVTTFAALARAVPASERAGRRLLVAVNGKRRDVFVQCFDSGDRPLGEAGALDPASLPDALPAGPLLIAGDGAPALKRAVGGAAGGQDGADARLRFSSALGPPDAAHVAALAAAAAQGGTSAGKAPLRPVYIRPPDARLPAAGGDRP